LEPVSVGQPYPWWVAPQQRPLPFRTGMAKFKTKTYIYNLSKFPAIYPIQAAEHAAMMYSFFGTCKLNGIEPYQWLKNTLTTIADARVNDLEKYLPIKQEEA
jgi:hypothetical protein